MNPNYNQYYMFMGDYPKTMHQRTKRLRGTNYTAREKKIFFQIIEADPRRRLVIESKVLTSESLSRKAQVWEEVAREFNNYAEHKRSVKQLKILYDNLRRRARKNLLEGQTDPYFSKAQIFDTPSENEAAATENKLSEVMVKTELDEVEQNGAESYSGESWALDEPSSVTLNDLSVLGSKVAVAEEVPSSRPNTDNVHKMTPNNFQVPFNPEWGTHPAPPCLTGVPMSGGNKGGADDAPHPRRNTSYKKKLTINYKMKYFKQKFQNALLEHRHQKVLFNLDVKIKKKQMELLSKQIESVL